MVSAVMSRIVVAHQGVTVPTTMPSDLDRPFVLMLGTVEPRKNIALACRAFGRFAAEYPKSHL